MTAELVVSSWETIARRTWMMAQGRCSPAEYRRMVGEKVWAAYLSGVALASTRGNAAAAAALKPWHRRATANAKRLRKK
jgi:hypothetical protein